MRAIVCSDFHLHQYRECSRDGGADRLNDGLQALRQTLVHARERKCYWVCCGDIKHLKGVWPVTVLNGTLAVLEEFDDVTKIILHGNHDGVGSGRGGLFPLGHVASVFDEPAFLTLDEAPHETVAIWPWQPTLEGLPAFLKEARKRDAHILLAHAFLSGARLGPADLRFADKGASLEAFGLAGARPQFTWALFGDVHKEQSLSTKVAQIWYPGSPLATNWGELETDKGCLFVDTEVGTVEQIPVQAPRFRIIDITPWPAQDVAALSMGKRMGKERTCVGDWPGDFVRVLANGHLTESMATRMRDVSSARSFQVIRVQEEDRTEQRVKEYHAGLPVGELIARYVAARPPDGLDAEAVVAAGKRLLEG